jgi:hypothetical protein
MRFWGDSAFGVGGIRKRSLRVPSPVARLNEAKFIHEKINMYTTSKRILILVCVSHKIRK